MGRDQDAPCIPLGVRKTEAKNRRDHPQVQSVRQLDFYFVVHAPLRLSVKVGN